jgi:GTP cyclohydrolase I
MIAESRAPTLRHPGLHLGRVSVARSEVDLGRIERTVREILIAIGEDPDREGLVDTPQRVARAYRELFTGMRDDAGRHLARQIDQEHAGDDVVLLRNISFTSMYEHHLLPFTGMAHVAYLPAHGKVTGLSKLARTVDVFAGRPQLQELTTAFRGVHETDRALRQELLSLTLRGAATGA